MPAGQNHFAPELNVKEVIELLENATSFYSHGSQNSCGVAVLIRNGFNCTVKKTIIDPSGRFIVLKVDIEDKV